MVCKKMVHLRNYGADHYYHLPTTFSHEEAKRKQIRGTEKVTSD